jgi:hypothetical protein
MMQRIKIVNDFSLRKKRMSIKKIMIVLGVFFIAAAAGLCVMAYITETNIRSFAKTVVNIGNGSASKSYSGESFDNLPVPVQRYFSFVFKENIPRYSHVNIELNGQFRRPQTNTFSKSTASQTIAVGEPAMVFSATIPIRAGIWAKAYDFYANGKMEMKAQLLSAITVVDEKKTPELDHISLRRWLMESPLYPMALLPGGVVRWEAVDNYHSRAIVTAHGMSAALLATFDDDGRLMQFATEEDGDLTTPYHGSGELAERTDYRPIAGMMIPHDFVISRVAQGKEYPFWRGRISNISFIPATVSD